jgi:hypothetical protein
MMMTGTIELGRVKHRRGSEISANGKVVNHVSKQVEVAIV